MKEFYIFVILYILLINILYYIITFMIYIYNYFEKFYIIKDLKYFMHLITDFCLSFMFQAPRDDSVA